MDAADTFTDLLTQHGRGDRAALDQMFPILYDELRRIARSYMRRESTGHTLQPTALVNEAYFKLVKQRNVDWNNRRQFLGVAAQVMRRLLVDHARHKAALREGGDVEKVPVDEALDAVETPSVDLLALDLALQKLAKLEPRHAQVIELRYFGGLSIEETADVLESSPATVKRDWTVARAWLHSELAGAFGDAVSGSTP